MKWKTPTITDKFGGGGGGGGIRRQVYISVLLKNKWMWYFNLNGALV
jgi:hypothetical protein